ncbi:MAG: sigma-70 family RNA polymerase sigma factor [Planctomycetes bacterium]|nr:sigma-70 family RNA polymerase sigma factor [Planctomycetota bacterium]
MHAERRRGLMHTEASMDLVADQPSQTKKRTLHRVDVPGLWRVYWKKPSDQRRNRLVEAYQSLLKVVVQRFAQRLPRSVDRGDLETAANFGLMGAIASFDATRMVRFEIYAEMRIRGAVLDELRAQDWLPRPWRTRLDLQKRTLEMLRSELGREPTDPEVASSMGVPFEEYELLFGTALPGIVVGSMPALDGGDEPVSRLDGVADTRSDQPGEELTRTELLRLLAQRMSEQEYRIVYLKYWEDLSMREIGELTGISESRVCKIHAKLLERLKDRFRAQGSELSG